jgi:hypothetical protein
MVSLLYCHLYDHEPKKLTSSSQYLAVIFPTKNYCDLDRKKFLKALDEIEQELKQTPHALSGLALMELNKLRVVLD